MLSLHSRTILEAEPSQQSRNSTVVFCVLLRDKRGYLKKFVFHNGISAMSGHMREKAKELGYDIIRAEQSHAEAQFLQFLYKRKDGRPGYYTHIVGMGCSKKHCSECNALMELLLGPNYHEITSSIDHGQAPAFPERTVTHSYLPNPKGGISLVYQTKIDLNKVSKKEAVDADALYDRYYLSEALKSQIKDNVYDDELDLLAQRFSNYLNLKDQKKNTLDLEGKITVRVSKKLQNLDLNEVTDQDIDDWTTIIINQLKKIKKNNINNDNEGYAIGYCKAQFEVYRDLRVMESEEQN